MRIAIISMAWYDFGGWPTYTKHLSRGLTDNGIKHSIICGKNKPRKGWRSILPFGDWDDIKKSDLIYIVCFRAKEAKIVDKILKYKKPIILLLHDPTEWKPKNAVHLIRKLKPKQIHFIGKMPKARFGFDNPMFSKKLLHVHLHPYKRISDGKTMRKGARRAICTSRIDFDKRTHVILQAECGVEFWTGYYDWRYVGKMGFKKAKEIPGYKGQFGFSDEDLRKVYEGAAALVDMSTIKGDGGRTQYTFLEAMDFGLSMVLPADWAKSARSELLPGVHFYPVRKVDDIRKGISEAVRKGNKYKKEHEKILKNHNAKKVCKKLVETFEEAI